MLEGNIHGELKLAATGACYGGDKEKILSTIKNKLPPIMKYMKGAFLTGNTPVYMDFYFFEFVEMMAFLTQGKVFDDFPKLAQYHQNVASLPKLKEYLASSANRDAKYDFNNKMAKINANGTAVTALIKAAYQKHGV